MPAILRFQLLFFFKAGNVSIVDGVRDLNTQIVADNPQWTTQAKVILMLMGHNK